MLSRLVRRLTSKGGASPKADVPLSRIKAEFERSAADEEHFPSTIDPRIYHVRLLAEYFGPLAGKRVLDAGCGKGRFARVLLEENPDAWICGLDLAEAMLRHVPPGAAPCAASITALPFPDGVFDYAYATESLEHVIHIETAVAELCRVVRPGGRIAVIDKNAEHWGRLATPEWERWFRPEELERLLARHCRQVSHRFISYWEDVEPDGLFVAWLAER